MSTQFALGAVALALAMLGTQAARAAGPGPAFNQPIVFADAGSVTLTLESSSGSFDHVLERAGEPGAIGAAPLLALTDLIGGPPSASVLGYAPGAPGDRLDLGSVVAGQEFVFRLTNVGSGRLGAPGAIVSQVFTGSASMYNPQTGRYYTLIEWIGPTQVRVQIEEHLPEDPTRGPTALSSPDLQFLLTLSPIPEPEGWAMMLGGLAALALLARRRLG